MTNPMEAKQFKDGEGGNTYYKSVDVHCSPGHVLAKGIPLYYFG